MYLGTNATQMHLPFQGLPSSRDTENPVKPIGNPKKKIILSERDYEVLQFILEMKFASILEVYQKFFKSPYLTIASLKPEANEEYPRGFYIRNYDNALWLRGYRADDHCEWPNDNEFIFLK